MAEAEIDLLKEVLGWRLTRFMNRNRSRADTYQGIIDRMLGRGETVALFGGALRDLLSKGASANPRDLDLVIGSSETHSASEDLGCGTRNSFGGQRAQVSVGQIDLWPLSKTWAFRALGTGKGSFEDLARTTFLNVEAITVVLKVNATWLPLAWDNRFFRAFLDRLVEINLEENPNPLGCVARSLVTASNLRFALGPRLVSYIGHHLERIAPEELVDFQKSHYGMVVFPAPEIALIKSAVSSHLRTRRSRPLPLFVARQGPRQGMSVSVVQDFAERNCVNGERMSVTETT